MYLLYLHTLTRYVVPELDQGSFHTFSQKTPLHYAAENDKLNVVKLLLERRAQVDGRVDHMWPWNSPTKMVISYYSAEFKRPLSIYNKSCQRQFEQNHQTFLAIVSMDS